MSAIKGDFTGFTFNGVHSSELGLTRVSDGNRYSENLFPAIQDKTVQIPGADGTYYFGSYYTQQPFNISVVFDDMSEEQFQRIRKVFGDKKVHDLIFDETPYKVYRVKTTGTPNLKYICFDKGPDEFDRDFSNEVRYESKEQLYGISARSSFGRVYKGEGQLNFVCYTPFARSRYKYIDEYTVQTVPEWGSMDTDSADHIHYNLYDWAEASGLKTSLASVSRNNTVYQLDNVTNSGVLVYNPGNFPVHFQLVLLFSGTFGGCMVGSPLDEDYQGSLTLKSFSLKSQEDLGIRINGNLNLIEGIKEDPDTVEYVKINVTTGKNPQQEGWYVLQGNNYVLTSDTSPQSNTTYYKRKVKYVSTGTIYNEYITAGDFFKIPNTSEFIFLPISVPSGGSPTQFRGLIEYDYLYY